VRESPRGDKIGIAGQRGRDGTLLINNNMAAGGPARFDFILRKPLSVRIMVSD
jgi:hypothetical protein